MESQMVAAPARGTVERGDGYEALLEQLATHGALLPTSQPLFTTTATALGAAFLSKIPDDARQHYNCRACLTFLDRFGGLVTINDAGETRPALWGFDVPEYFRPAIEAVGRRVLAARVDGVFVSSAKVWGLPSSKDQHGATWRHLSVPDVPYHLIDRNTATRSSEQAAAALVQDHGMLLRAIAEYPHDAVKQALRVLRSEALFRGEKVLGVAEWFDQVHEQLTASPLADMRRGELRRNVLWRAVATAPAGFAHVRSSMIGTLLDDIVAGLSFDAIKRRFEEKMDPQQYRRPTASPSEGAIAQAEKLVEQLGVARSLPRRFARLADIVPLWSPRAAAAAPDAAPAGVFGHLRTAAKPAAVRALELPPTVMTWDKFRRQVLPGVRELEVFTGAVRIPFCALVTAVDPDAPNLMQWNNPVSWYLYEKGSYPSAWALPESSWVKVTALTELPPMWGDTGGAFARFGLGIVFLLDGARDKAYQRGGSFFPEHLRGEFHSIRSVIEAHAKDAQVAGWLEADAAGLMFQKGARAFTVDLRVNGADRYRLDRWD